MHKLLFVTLFFLYSCSSPKEGGDYDLKHIQLGSLLESRVAILNNIAQKSDGKKDLVSLSKLLSENESKLNTVLFPNQQSVKASFLKNDDDESALYKEITDYLDNKYDSIGDEESSKIIGYNKVLKLGESNFAGFIWEKAFAHFQVGVDRQISPDLFDANRYIVCDKFILKINASTYLSNLKDAGLIDFTSKQIGAFAGITFTREYVYTHFSASYVDALTEDYEKLFLSFIKFKDNNYLELDPGEIITKNDSITTAAGGVITIPGEYANVEIGALVENENIAYASVQRPVESDLSSRDEYVRINYKSSKIRELTVEAELAVDFFKLIKLTLLSYESSSTTTEMNELCLSFSTNDLPILQEGGQLSLSVSNLLQLKRKKFSEYVVELAPYIVSKERRTAEDLNSQYGFLLYGGIKSVDTSHVEIKKGDVEKIFFKNKVKQVSYVKNPSYPVVEAILKSGVFTSLFTKYKYVSEKELSIEYAVDSEFKDVNYNSENDIVIPEKGEYSLNINFFMKHMKTKSALGSKYIKKFTSFIKDYTTLNGELCEYIENGKFIGPVDIESKLSIQQGGVTHLLRHNNDELFGYFKDICGYKSFWSGVAARECYQDLRDSYATLKNHNQSYDNLPLMDFRSFIAKVNKYASNVGVYKYLFGANYIFINGSFYAMSATGVGYKTFFKDGQFVGLGVIDNYRRSTQKEGLKIPAAIE